MKKLGIGFLAVIAVLAMSFTVVNHHESAKKAAVVEECYTQVTITTPTPPLPPASFQRGTSASCSNAELYESEIASTFSGTVIDDPETECPGGNVFCCALVETTTGEILNVFCEED